MNKRILILASFLGLTSVIIGAFGAHGLKEVLDAEQLQTFEVGVRYQMYHALFLLFIGLIDKISEKTKSTIFYLVFVGVIFFSGSIYGLATNDLTGFDFSKIALITPIGGALLIASWAILLINFLKYKEN
ncbi:MULTISPECIES: DUF423 domain-containing protein [Mesoflavibacter]|uniref:DUF423 domain-containing protein n=1 Tax=Mesoflavibacter zeaxanthinifaciens subsp. sabulilitoris TaxID=1520893 RepID=A0A2T1N783_9FLAO|nr:MULTISPECIES: DUF423 domain-containing protein [Mesoflavibacter]MBB3124103.1 uncharacterized membrane protein YgdD (TMEM256/DUF423 family) [Mesoflavibacter zeaxanthinifaciens subsp. sabulilitoris]MCP4052457.1 DUF423 domain-containing protein [Mesoflavibacter sp.]PSG87732.1 DUF423 domain-containing protein [Mesoflavibacter zeaxanthinifaciens subsp. sabulilitoris]UAB76182.1 DUF423 domain-containing protein [Mesoflavibacter sp. SCSIO 43206]